MITKLYPGGKRKAFNISYDDGVVQDIRFVEMLNRYGLKGTFNLNSRLMKEGFVWTHECGMDIRRLSEQEAVCLYTGHEVASHTLTHPYMHDLSREEILCQLGQDKADLEALFERKVGGFAVPFTYYSEQIAQCAMECGFEYARISEESRSYLPCPSYYWWKGGILHWSADLMEFVDEFLYTDEELAVCQIVGHSYDLDVEDKWDTMETVCRKVSDCDEIWPCTNLELVRYLKAMDSAEISDHFIYNPSRIPLWFCADGRPVQVSAKEGYWYSDGNPSNLP